jgi:hypothetical protein
MSGNRLIVHVGGKTVSARGFTFRYEFEVYARTTTQGNAMVISAVFPFKPIKIK